MSLVPKYTVDLNTLNPPSIDFSFHSFSIAKSDLSAVYNLHFRRLFRVGDFHFPLLFWG